jgi:superfamily II DNA/RNA helicase
MPHLPLTRAKPLVLYRLIQDIPHRGMLVFASSLEHTHRFAALSINGGLNFLTDSVCSWRAWVCRKLPRSPRRPTIVASFFTECVVLWGFSSSSSLVQFKSHKVKVLVCSDILSRGIDFEGVDVVVNYDIPSTVKSYVHRLERL